MSRAYRWLTNDRLPEWTRSMLPANKEHSGACKSCGADTRRNVTAGGPGHPRNGWECHACGEHYLALEMAGADLEKL